MGAKLQRRVEEPEVVARITIGVLDAGGEKGAALGVERLDDEADAGGVVQPFALACDVESGAGVEAVGHGLPTHRSAAMPSAGARPGCPGWFGKARTRAALHG